MVNNLDISETEYNNAVKSYQAVGSWLADKDSLLSPYSPEILPQGSFLLGTMIKPINNNDELDVDLVCRLVGKNFDWTQYDLKQVVGNRLKENKTYRNMLDKEGRRCWTLNYSNLSKYHMDILPSIVSDNYREILESTLRGTGTINYEKAAIRITDNKNPNYYTETNPDLWNKSNPFGYAGWFQERCRIPIRESVFLSGAIKPLPNHQKEKLPLQKAVQILKRHRDIMFNGDEDKPISIIITTLAAKAYNKQTSLVEALFYIVNTMESKIEIKYSPEHGKSIVWISNPVNEEENFADKWVENPRKEQNFRKWIKSIKGDILSLFELRGLHQFQESFSKTFGENISKLTFENIANQAYLQRENGKLYMKQGTGYLGSSSINSTIVKKHSFHGYDEK